MDYEKKYKEALGWMQSLYNGLHGKTKEEAERYFPELAESEDERIRKELYKYFRDLQLSSDREFSPSTNIDEILAWLEKQGEKESDPRYENLEEILAADDIYQMSMNDEMVQEAKEKAVNALSGMCIGRLLGLEKQGEYKETLCEKCKREHPSHSCQDITELGRCAIEHEQKPADKAEPKYKAGDWVQVEHGNIMKILDVSEFTYTILSCYGYRDIRLISDVDSISHLWTIQDAKDGDKLILESMFPELAESEDERIRKELLEYLQRCVKCNPLTEETEKLMKDSIAWLEKQDEKKIVVNMLVKARLTDRG